MAAPTRSTKYNSLGVSAGPEETVLVDTVGATATGSVEFGIVGPCIAVEVFVNFVKTGAAPSVVFSIDAFDVGAQAWVPLLTSAAVVATGVLNLLVGTAVPNQANLAAAHLVRERMRVTATHGNADVATYSITVVAASG